MEPFTVLTGLVAPLDRANVDTDAIIPKQFLKSIKRSGFGPNLFDAWRYLDRGEPGMDNAAPAAQSGLRAERAALPGARDPARAPQFRLRQLARARAVGAARLRLPRGDRAVVRRHLLQQLLQERPAADRAHAESQVDRLFADAPGASRVPPRRSTSSGRRSPRPTARSSFGFEVEPFRKHCLLNGLDDIGLTLHARRRDPRVRGEAARRAAVARVRAFVATAAAHEDRGPARRRHRPGDRRRSRARCSTCCGAKGSPLETETAPIGGAGYDAAKHPLPEATLALARAADAVLLGAVGGPQYDALPRALRPEQGILGIRKALGLFANLRPALLYPELAAASTLKPEVVAGLDIMIVRELTGDIYFGEPRGRRKNAAGEREGFDTMRYSEPRDRAHRARRLRDRAQARRRSSARSTRPTCSTRRILWREVVTAIAKDYPDVALSHMYVDNAAMQLVRNPKQFDVIVTGNMFGDILSDEASMLAGSIGMLPSASLDANGKGLYEPIHGSAPDIAGQDKANPLATILSRRDDVPLHVRARRRRRPHRARGARGAARRACAPPTSRCRASGSIGTRAMGDAVVAALRSAESRGRAMTRCLPDRLTTAHAAAIRSRGTCAKHQTIKTTAGRRLRFVPRAAGSRTKRGAKVIAMRVGFVGWRGMVGSVLMQRMREERDFDLIEPVFFSTSNVGGKGPAIGKRHAAARRTRPTSRRSRRST